MGGPADKPVLWTSTFTSGTLAHQVAAVSGLPFELRFISLRAGDHKKPDYLVVNPKGEPKPRYSMPFFVHPHFDVTLEVMKECLKDGEKPKYEPINNHDFLLQRLREIGLKAS